MLSGMKPLPKALIIFLPIAIAIGVYVKFVPEKKVEPVAPPVAVQVVPAEASAVQPAPAATEPQASVVDEGQNAGMKALLEKGKK